MILAGNSNVACFMPQGLNLSSPHEQVKVCWVGALKIGHFFDRHPAGEKVRDLFRTESGWKLLSIGVHDIFDLFRWAEAGKLEEGLESITCQYQTVLREFRDLGRFGWLVFPQPVHLASHAGMTGEDLLAITRAFNKRLEGWCREQGIIVINPLARIIGNDDNTGHFLQRDNIHLSQKGAELFLAEISASTGTQLQFRSEAMFEPENEVESFCSLILNNMGIPLEERLPAAQLKEELISFVKNLLDERGIEYEVDSMTELVNSGLLDSLDLVQIYSFASKALQMDIVFEVNLRELNTIDKLCGFILEKKDLTSVDPQTSLPAQADFLLSLRGDFDDMAQRESIMAADRKIAGMSGQLAQLFWENVVIAGSGQDCPYGVVLFWIALNRAGRGDFSDALEFLAKACSSKRTFPFASSRSTHYRLKWEESVKSRPVTDDLSLVTTGASEAIGLTPDPAAIPLLWDPGRHITSEDDLLQVLAKIPVNRIIRTIYIVGAHLFQERELINRLFPNLRRIYLFEPIPELYRHLQETTADDRRIRVFPYAIADRDEMTSFNITNNHASSSLLHLGKHLEIFPHVSEVASIKVECRTLETVIRENALADPDMLFIDVQGAEYQVLSALSARIRSRVRLIYTEASTEELYVGSRPLGDIQAMLDPEFCFLGFAPLTNDTPTHGNALFVNRNALHLMHTGTAANDQLVAPAGKDYLVSAIVSTYNAERFIRGKLEDLEAQTIAERLEIIVIDSGSQENERAVVEEFQRRYTNIRYIRTAQRETVYQAWNRGGRAATGRFITNANTDDRLRRDAIEVMVNALMANPHKVMAYGDSIVTLVAHETFDHCTPHDYLRWPDFDRDKLLEFCYLGPHPVWRREVHDAVGWFDERYQCAADYEFWLRLAMQYEFVHVPELLGLYWQNEGTVSRRGELPIREAVSIRQKYRKHYAEMNATNNHNIFPLSTLAHRYCTGKGLEIGGSAHNPFGLNTLNVDIFDSPDTIYKQEEMRMCGKAMPVDIVSSGDDIPLPDNSQDFIVSSHVLEHFPNPVKALLEWDRLVKPGGTIFMIVPHKERTFDNVQPRTTLQHVIDDYYNNATEPHPNPQGHDHCWITEDISNLCDWMIRELGVQWEIIDVQDVDDKVGNGFTIVIRKKGARLIAAETNPAITKTAPQSVLLVVHGFPPAAVGGVEVYTRNLAMEMAAKGIRVTVLYPVMESSEPEFSFTSEIVDDLTLTKFHVPRGHLFTSILSEKIDCAFDRFLRTHAFDFIHFHHLFNNLSLSMIAVAKKSAVPVAVTLHDFWFICPRAQLFIENNTSVCTGPETPAKCADCVVLTGWFPGVDRVKLEQVIKYRLEYVRGLLADVDLIFTPSRFVADIFKQYGFGAGKIAVSPLGIGKFTVHRSAQAAGPRFGYMGTIHPVKNVMSLVRSFAATRGEASLHLFGGGEARRVRELTECISDPRITYHGSYTSQQLPEILADIDVLVVPSLIESYCLTVREALSAGIPVLASRVGGIPEIVQNGVNGILYDPFAGSDLSLLLQQLISDNSAYLELNGNALPIMTIALDARLLLERYATVMHRPGLPNTELLQVINSAENERLPESVNPIPAGKTPATIKVAVYSLDAQVHACCHYRLKAPLAALADTVEVTWATCINGNTFTIDTDAIKAADIIVVQRFFPRPDTRDFLNYLCSLGKPVIYECDDLLTQLPKSNPSYEWGKQGAPHIHDFLKKCAAVTVSTDELKAHFSAYNDTIYVLPNMLDSRLWERPSPPSSGPVVIGYAGTNTHGSDLELLEEVLDRIAERYGNKVSLTFMGCSTERISRLAGFRFVQFERTYEAYARKLMEIPMDIVLAPLEDNPFNRCKSNVKWLEYSACGIAGIYSDLPPYACVKSGETGLLVRNTVADWYNALADLIDHPEKRRQIGLKARKEVMEHYTVAGRAPLYLDTYKRVLNAHQSAVRKIRFSIIIMTWNRAAMLEQCLTALFAGLTDRDNCQIIVGNNGSTDNTEEILSRYRVDEYVKKTEKAGLEFYRELFDLAEGEYIIELDDDVLDLPKHFDTVFEEYFRSFPDYGFLGLDVVQNRYTNGAKPEPSQYMEDVRTQMTVQEGEVIGCCACIKKETFEQIGRFDGVILSMARVEDGVLTERVRNLGLRTGIIKDVNCFHANGPYYSKAYGYIDRDIEKYAMAGMNSIVATYREIKEEKKTAPSVSIIIPLFNKVEYTRQCLEGVARATTSLIDFELILVDNASTDGTSEYLRTLPGRVTIITNITNLGFARACNQGARLATKDFLVFLNNDTIPKAGWLEALVEGIERDGADICGARLLYPNGTVQHAGVAFNEQGLGYHVFNGFDANAQAVTRKRFMQCVTAACMIMRRELFQTLSGFDEGYVNGFEDVDLCLRAGELGKRILYVPDCTLTHFEETSEGRKDHDGANARRYFARWKGKVRCDDDDYYHLEGYRKELLPDGRINLFKVDIKGEKKMAPTVSIIIPLFNKVEYTRQCLEGVASATAPIDFELILVDNASTDGTSEYLRTLSGSVTIITNITNLGFARACNQGARLATKDIIVFLNNDTIPHRGWLEALVDGIERDGADICGARLLYPNGTIQHAGIAFNEQGMCYKIFNGFDANAQAVTRKRFMQCVTAACMIMRRELFHSLSGFDEGYVNGYEGVDLCLRAGEFGKRILYIPESTLTHFEQTSEGRTVHDAANARRYLSRWKGKVRCDDNDFYRMEGFRKELLPDGRIHLFQMNPEQPAPMKREVPEKEPAGQNRFAPPSLRILIEKGKSLKIEGQYDEALEAFSSARNLGDTSVLAQMGDCLANLGKSGEAEEAYLDALRVRGDDSLAHTGIGVVKLLAQQYSEASIAFGKALQGDPANSRALCGLGMSRYGQGHKKASYNYFLKALDADPENILALHELIRTSYEMGEFAQAVIHSRNYLMYHPADLDILFSFAGILYKTGAYEEACDVLERLMALSPEYQGGKELLEIIATASVNNAPLRTANAVDTSSRNSLVTVIEQGRMNKAAGNYNEAFECFSKARDLGDLSVLSEMGDCKANIGAMMGARSFYEEGLLNNPYDAQSLVGLGVLSLIEQNLTEASAYFGKALMADKDNPRALCGLAMLRNLEGRESDAHDLFMQALDRDPENMVALGGLVKCAYQLKRFTEAERHLENYLRYHPADLDMLFSQAGIQFKVGKYSVALDNIEKLLIFAPAYEGGQELKGKIEAMSGLDQAPAYQYQIAGCI